MDPNRAKNALMMAVWRRQPDNPVLVHSDQGIQFSSHDWKRFLKAHGLVCNMSRRGNGQNALAESTLQLLRH